MRNGRIQIGDFKLIHVIFLIGQILCYSCNSKSTKKNSLELQVAYNLDSTFVTSIGYTNTDGKQGEWYFFDKEGRLEIIENYQNNIVHGKVEVYKCCRKFQEMMAINGKIVGRVANFSPNGEIISISYNDSSQVSFYLSLNKFKVYEINEFDENRNFNLVYSDTSINEIDEFPSSYGCCVEIDDY